MTRTRAPLGQEMSPLSRSGSLLPMVALPGGRGDSLRLLMWATMGGYISGKLEESCRMGVDLQLGTGIKIG
jgi:hypothetical protein